MTRYKTDPVYREYKKQADKTYYREHRDAIILRTRNSFLKKEYGITLTDFEEMWAQQKGLCAICHKELSRGNIGKNSSTYHVDHNHVTKVVRGILCVNCNMGIGFFLEQPNIMLAAIEYLEREKEWHH